MAALEELSARLMKPAKDLADWNFPFTEVLHEYYTLLEAEKDVNLNKAALVLQNSANTYVRRVEVLFQDTTSLMQSFADREAAEESQKSAKKDGKGKKAVIDIVDFEPIDFSEYVGKNNNLKNRNGVNNPVKLLGLRFPQLEISSRSLTLDETNSIETDQDQDNDREIVKKYAFRCNQYLTASGMLVEHLEPEDSPSSSFRFSPEENIHIPEQASSICGELGASELNHEFANDIDPSRILDGERRCVSTPLPETDTELMDTSFCSAVDSGRGSSIRTTARPDSSLSSDRDNWDPLPPRACSRLSINDPPCPEDSVLAPSSRNDETPMNDTSSPSKRGAEERDFITDCAETNVEDVTLQTEKIVAQNCRRSKRLRSIFDTIENSNSEPLQPIPFDIVPDVLPKSRTEFKLPCPISLLKFKERPRKRKISVTAKKRKSMDKFFWGDPEMGNTKLTMYSPTRQLFFPFMKEEFECLPKYLNKYWRDRQNLETIHYEAVTTRTMDLLGYKSHDRKPDSLRSEIAHQSEIPTTAEISSIINDNTPITPNDSLINGNDFSSTANDFSTNANGFPDSDNEYSNAVDDFPMPDTPESSRNSPEPTLSLTYSRKIERSVRDIYENSDVRTEQEESLIRWHKGIQKKLREVKHRSKFEIGEYTSRVMKSLRENDGRLTFKKMVHQNNPPDAARYLLASLMLANKYNLHIDTNEDKGDVMLLLLNE